MGLRKMTGNGHALTAAQLGATAAAVDGDAGRLYRIVGDLLDEGVSFDTVLFDLLIPAEKDLGTRWQNGDYLVVEEHAATATIETVVALLAGSFDQPDEGPMVVVAAAQGDRHSLPGRMVSAHLISAGHRTTFLGADVLASDLRSYLVDDDVEALVLSCAMTTDLPGARLAIEAAHDAGVPVIAGGQAFGAAGEWAEHLGADAWVAHPRDVMSTLETWSPDPSTTEASAEEPGPYFEELVSRRTEILAAAESAFVENGGSSVDNRTRDELRLLLAAVTAASLVDDATIVEDWVEWQQAMLESQNVEWATELADSLRSSLQARVPGAIAYLGA